MAPAKVTPEREEEAAERGPSAPDLLAILSTGATFGGVAVRVVRVELADGRVQRFELPAVVDATLSELAERMLEALLRVGDWTKGAALALLVDPSGDLEHVSGTFKRAVGELKAAGKIRSDKTQGYLAVQR